MMLDTKDELPAVMTSNQPHNYLRWDQGFPEFDQFVS